MRGSRYTYPLALIAMFAVFITGGNIIFGHMTVAEIYEEPEYEYLSPYAEISHYDHHFREAADTLDYDWTLIAAIAYTESRFDSTAVSGAGARGVMQMMPRTMRGMEIPDSMHMDTRTNIMAATTLLASLERHYRYIKDRNERLNFVLAAYNAGYGHINDAMRLAHKHGKNKYQWNGSVDTFLIYKSRPEYYNDTLCRNGEFKDWRQTLSFVKKVHRNWKRFSRKQDAYSDSIREIAASDTLKIILE